MQHGFAYKSPTNFAASLTFCSFVSVFFVVVEKHGKLFRNVHHIVSILLLLYTDAQQYRLTCCFGFFFYFFPHSYNMSSDRMVPVWEVLEFKWLRRQSQHYDRNRNVLRAATVGATGVVACVVPNFGLFVSLIGSRCVAFCVPLQFRLFSVWL